jgi:hypothetical protein
MILYAEKLKRGPTGEWAAENLAYLLSKASHTGVTMPLVVATLHTVALRCPFHRRTLANLGVGVVVEGVLADTYAPNRSSIEFLPRYILRVCEHSFSHPLPPERPPSDSATSQQLHPQAALFARGAFHPTWSHYMSRSASNHSPSRFVPLALLAGAYLWGCA